MEREEVMVVVWGGGVQEGTKREKECSLVSRERLCYGETHRSENES